MPLAGRHVAGAGVVSRPTSREAIVAADLSLRHERHIVNRADEERAAFLAAPDRERYLREHSHLPGPRGNLELLDAAAASAEPADLVRWAALAPKDAPTNTSGEFVVAVGTAGLGRLVARGDRSLLPALRRAAGDPRWRVREAVAIGLQAWGDADVADLLDEMERWATGSALEGRAAMAALCEPRLLRRRPVVERTLAILARLTANVRDAPDRRAPDVRALRQALGYGWSVAVAADPSVGWPAFRPLEADPDPDVRWIVTSNRGKARLAKLLPSPEDRPAP